MTAVDGESSDLFTHIDNPRVVSLTLGQLYGCPNTCEITPIYFDGLMQKKRNSIANALELRLVCIKPSTCRIYLRPTQYDKTRGCLGVRM